MNLSTLPFFERFSTTKRALIAGAGGGFDVFAGLPIYFALRKRGIDVHLANLSFSHLEDVEGPRLSPSVVEVFPNSAGPVTYFPEKYLMQWPRALGESARMFAFAKTGVAPLRRAYEALLAELAFDRR